MALFAAEFHYSPQDFKEYMTIDTIKAHMEYREDFPPVGFLYHLVKCVLVFFGLIDDKKEKSPQPGSELNYMTDEELAANAEKIVKKLHSFGQTVQKDNSDSVVVGQENG